MENNDPSQATSTCSNIHLDDLCQRTEAYFREEPIKAVGIAVAAGVVLTMFPVGRLLFGVLRLAISLLKPALLFLGGVKLYEEIQKRYGG